ncbi:Uncharacterized protein OS=Planctomyces brasiliensis (strain ATCC 49424 / DSM 5305 / JCM 21570 / NBRC 103401 / IFAM 1448) GN=Plabr_4392 PE=4 SV=1 [Gemmataceae bacterium]|nr:Uncharacterized protein OS=Planctomyces brasiliensis (strain ATCC 49424 / DSM 5305 / JCM 21570 / NBRC 103401 / IFAM 1448) GN=Plabr_4392 PE=4 SV=1 [Gemmataceae bacterium]VTT97113.1 Uncharacterized protein OS=Planctomyces brasiliensis (strain ATCC 49424 / DSM 5305 / JCM 21570 / NBRC 103401 / IFAM 1448) GN=Plabr_4392 PE=4 SV=1 [Gemmataceae bacterium]
MSRVLLVIVIACTTGPVAAAADDAYYLTLFTAEATPYRPEKTHTFLAITKVPKDGAAVENREMSWLPATLKVRGVALRAETGVNLSVADTLNVCRRDCMRVSVWGPYQIKPELYCRLSNQIDRLGEGKIKYKGTDNLYPSPVAMNCYHAIWNVSHPMRKFVGPFTSGDATGGKTVHLFREWIICPETTHDDILKVVGVDQEPLVRRSHDYWPSHAAAFRSFLGRY